MFSKFLDEAKTKNEIENSIKKLTESDILAESEKILVENKNIFSDSFQKFLYFNISEYHRRLLLPLIAKNLIKSVKRVSIYINVFSRLSPYHHLLINCKLL